MYEYRIGDLIKVVGEHRLFLITAVMADSKKCEIKYIHGNPQTEVGRIVDSCEVLEVIDHFDI